MRIIKRVSKIALWILATVIGFLLVSFGWLLNTYMLPQKWRVMLQIDHRAAAKNNPSRR